jgi:hypothetical protein
MTVGYKQKCLPETGGSETPPAPSRCGIADKLTKASLREHHLEKRVQPDSAVK